VLPTSSRRPSLTERLGQAKQVSGDSKVPSIEDVTEGQKIVDQVIKTES
jgi:hypothetical protein